MSASAGHNRPAGRRPGTTDTRDVVLSAARTVFAQRGFHDATIRRIAATADVDPALVHHYFGTKDQLFLAAIEAPIDPDLVLATVLAGPASEVGVRVVRTLLEVWDGPGGPGALALLRSAVNDERTATLLREFLLTRVIDRIMAALAVPVTERAGRGALVASQLTGLLVARYVLEVEPLASADREELAAAAGPTLQRSITADLDILRWSPDPGRHET